MLDIKSIRENPERIKERLKLRGGDVWQVEEIPDATPAQRAVREGWVTGRCG